MSAAMAQSPVAVALRPRPWMKYTNDVRARFRRTQTAQALGITWIDYFGASSDRPWAAQRLGHARGARAAMRSEADIQERGASVASVADDPLRPLADQICFDAQHRQLTMW
jgi:hypothetical protein